MTSQGHVVGATSREGACENSNLERQGCSPFYQDVTDDPYVDLVRDSLLFSPFAFTSFSFQVFVHTPGHFKLLENA